MNRPLFTDAPMLPPQGAQQSQIPHSPLAAAMMGQRPNFTLPPPSTGISPSALAALFPQQQQPSTSAMLNAPATSQTQGNATMLPAGGAYGQMMPGGAGAPSPSMMMQLKSLFGY